MPAPPERLDSRTRFDRTASDYERFRPGYPAELLDWVLATTGVEAGAPVADLGCGTGISTRLLAARGLDVVGIEPSAAMLERARRAGGGARYRAGEAAATGLASASQALVTGAQAFHWFCDEPALREIARVLRPGAWCAAWWNVRRDDDPLQREYEALLRRHSAEYSRVPRPRQALERLAGHPRVRDWTPTELAHEQLLDREAFLGRARSSSYVAHGVADRGAFEAALSALFDAHGVAGGLPLRYRVLAACWRLVT
jgi:SAM-dependent methyltransferase